MINEELARRAKENMSFSDYKAGSATSEYNEHIADVTAQIETAKKKVSPEAQTRLDNLLARYCVKYAQWTNAYNANGAGHVSVMISGPSNYNMRAHERYLKREGKLWEEYDELKHIDWKISAIVAGDKIIKSDDANAIEKLQDKLNKALEEHQSYKDYNVKARKEGTDTLPAYVLSNSNGRLKGIRDRIKRLERLASIAETTPIEERTEEVNGIQIIDNIEANRLQIVFPGKPDADTRTKLKKAGFRWSPTNGAWQSYRNYHAESRAKEIIATI
jgi:hypothetical protein